MAADKNWTAFWEKRRTEWKEDLEKLKKQFEAGKQEAENTFEEQRKRFEAWLEEQREEFRDEEGELKEEWKAFRTAFDNLINKLRQTAEKDAKKAESDIADGIEDLRSEAEDLEGKAKEKSKTLLDEFTDSMSRWEAKLKAAALNVQVETSEEFEEWRKEAREKFAQLKEKADAYGKETKGEWAELRSDLADVLEKFASRLRDKKDARDEKTA